MLALALLVSSRSVGRSKTMSAKPISIQKLIFSGLVVERFALGLTAALRPSAVSADKSTGRLFTRGFGIRHFAFGAGLLLFRKNQKSLVRFAALNAAVEAADAFAILKESRRSTLPKSLAFGSLIGAIGCLALAFTSASSSSDSSS